MKLCVFFIPFLLQNSWQIKNNSMWGPKPPPSSPGPDILSVLQREYEEDEGIAVAWPLFDFTIVSDGLMANTSCFRVKRVKVGLPRTCSILPGSQFERRMAEDEIAEYFIGHLVPYTFSQVGQLFYNHELPSLGKNKPDKSTKYECASPYHQFHYLSTFPCSSWTFMPALKQIAAICFKALKIRVFIRCALGNKTVAFVSDTTQACMDYSPFNWGCASTLFSIDTETNAQQVLWGQQSMSQNWP